MVAIWGVDSRLYLAIDEDGTVFTTVSIYNVAHVYIIVGASLSEPHCYVANRGKRNALWCVRTRNFSTVIKIPSACDRNFYQFVVNLPIVFPSSQLLRQFAWLRISQDASHFARRFTFRKTLHISQDASHFARRNLLAELVEQ